MPLPTPDPSELMPDHWPPPERSQVLPEGSRSPPPDRSQLMREIRSRLSAQLYDESLTGAGGVAIYSLSDPRDIRFTQYVGQTLAPRRRLLQHLCAARLWLPDERPWWVRSPRLRPLYTWIREMYRDGGRLPVLVVCEWVDAAQARAAEQARIAECLQRQLPLLNFEARQSLREARPAVRD
jgi:hypothetical protein